MVIKWICRTNHHFGNGIMSVVLNNICLNFYEHFVNVIGEAEEAICDYLPVAIASEHGPQVVFVGALTQVRRLD